MTRFCERVYVCLNFCTFVYVYVCFISNTIRLSYINDLIEKIDILNFSIFKNVKSVRTEIQEVGSENI